MAAATKAFSYEEIMRDIRAKRFKPVYLLMGAESYYIDQISRAILDAALTEDERAFNLTTLFGAETDIDNVINCAKSYPMGAAHAVVMVREAQNLKQMDELASYLQHPQPTTILVLAYKNGVVDRRKKFATAIASIGVLYESKKVSDGQLPALVTSYVKEHGFDIDSKSASLVADSIGADLNRLYGELDKLFVSMPKGKRAVSPDIIERNIGISKDFNYFELQNALVEKNVFKANQIAKYFDKNQKANPIQVILPMLFRFFSNIMTAYYAPQKTERGLAEWLGMTDWQVRRNIIPVFRNYSARKVLDILEEIRLTDEKSKGMNGSKVSSGDLLKQLLFFILH